MPSLDSVNRMYPWPYPIKYDVTNEITVDVLVIGGGLAGGCAGIAAAKRGAKVAIVDKAPIKRSGNGGAGMDHWNTVLDNPGSPMTPEENIEKTMLRAHALCHRDYIAIKGTWEALLELEQYGLAVRDLNGDFAGCATRDEKTKFLKAYDYRELVAVKLAGGQYIKPVIYDGLRKEGAQLYERVMMTCLLTEGGVQGGRVVGATGFSLETGEFYVFHAKSVIIATGYACSMWIYNMDITGNSYRWDPNEVGEGLAMAWNAGAQVHGFFKAGNTDGCHPFAWPRFGIGNPSNTWFPCTIVDNNGKVIPWEDKDGNIVETVEARNYPIEGQRYIGSGASDKLKADVKMPGLIHDLPDRIRNGEYQLPLWADLAGMPEDERRSIWGVMIGNEGKTRYTLYDLYTRAGFNPERDMLQAPIMTPEGYLSGGWFHGEPNAIKPWRSERGGQGEVVTDWNNMTNIEGLFCAGATTGLEGCSFACSSGFYSGHRAYEYSEKTELGKIDETQLQAEKERVYAPVRRMGDPASYISWKELWSGIARVMQQCCAEFKTKPILEHGLLWLDSIRKTEVNMTYARNPHELARVLECDTRIDVCDLFMRACISKMDAEDNGVDDKTFIFNRKHNGQFLTEFMEDAYWLKGSYQSTYLENYQLCRQQESVWAEQRQTKNEGGV